MFRKVDRKYGFLFIWNLIFYWLSPAQMRKRSGANFDELLNKDWNVLSKNEQLELQNQYKKAELKPGGGITFYDLIFILRCTPFPIKLWFSTSARKGGTK